MKYVLVNVFVGCLLAGSVPAYAACKTGIDKPNTIYLDNGDGTITDNETGLMWQKCSLGFSNMVACTGAGSASTVTWKGALDSIESANSGSGMFGYKDWRLPNAKELASLVDKNCMQPAINQSVFPAIGTGSEEYWTSTIDVQPGLESRALYVRFDTGAVQRATKNSSYQVRRVRGGH